MIIYVVTRGCYSDYEIAAIFSTKELAEKLVKKLAEKDLQVRLKGDAQWKKDHNGQGYYSAKQLTIEHIIMDENIQIEQWEVDKEYDGRVD